MRLGFYAAFFMFAASAVKAEIEITAGEHENYSRIVISGETSNLTMETAGKRLRLQNVASASKVNLDDINNGKKAFRIKNALAINPNSLEFHMDCDCAVRTARLDDGRLVIDILEVSAPKSAAVPSKTVQKTPSAPTPKPRKKAPSAPAQKPSQKIADAPIDDRLSVDQARDRMVSLLQQAADEGLITLKSDNAQKTPTQTAKAENQALASAPTNLLPPQSDPTIPDEPQADQYTKLTPSVVKPPEPPKPVARLCETNQAIAIDAVSFEEAPLVTIEALQTELTDKSGADAAILKRKIAEGYLAIGLGEEAYAVLSDGQNTPSAFVEIAQTVAQRSVAQDGYLLGAKKCSGAHALWQSVANESDEARAQFNRSGEAINALPSRLKQLVATRLAIKMVDRQAWTEAQTLFDIASSGADALSPELQYVQVRLNDQDGVLDETNDALRNVVENGSAASDNALLALADNFLENGGTPYEGFAEDIGSLAKLTGSSRAAFSEAYAWAANGSIEAALMILKKEAQKSTKLKASASKAASGLIKRALVQNDADQTIGAVRAYLDHEDWLDAGAPDLDMRLAVADAVSQAGLPNLALDLMRKNTATLDDLNRRKIAQYALAARDAQTAIELSAAHAAEPAFGGLLAEAYLQQKRYHEALAIAARIDDEKLSADLKARAGWLAGSWPAAFEGFRKIDPKKFDDTDALQFALSAYMAGERKMPSAADAALLNASTMTLEGLRSLFASTNARSTLERSKKVENTTGVEIAAFKELLSDG